MTIELISGAEMLGVVKLAIEAEGSQTAFAKKHGISLTYLNDMLRGRRPISTLVLDAVGYEAETVYAKK